MKVLFFMQYKGFVRHFEPTLRLMASRGDRLHLAFDQMWPEQEPLTQHLLRDHPGITAGPTPAKAGVNPWTILGEDLRAALNYLFYFEPWFHASPRLRARMEAGAPRTVQRLAAAGVPRVRPARELLTRMLRAMERALPPRPEIHAFIREQDPDLVLVTPLVHAKSPQADYVRAAKQLGVRTGLLVASWDNFTMKGRVHEVPDFVTLWNHDQKREAVEMHGVPASRIRITGAQTFDHWFGWRASTTRVEFCERTGLDPDLPFLLYVASSPFVLAEPRFVTRWVRALRGKGGSSLAKVQILVRPYPSAVDQWRAPALAETGPGVAVWPLVDTAPGVPEGRHDFYDSMHHAAAVVGINTSAMVESVIAGRPVFTILSPEFRDAQQGALHFKLISERAGGIVKVATSLEQHVSQLSATLSDDGVGDPGREDRRRLFLERFVRPQGLARPASSVLLEAIDEECVDAASGPAPGRPSAALRLMRPLARAARKRRARTWALSDREARNR